MQIVLFIVKLVILFVNQWIILRLTVCQRIILNINCLLSSLSWIIAFYHSFLNFIFVIFVIISNFEIARIFISIVLRIVNRARFIFHLNLSVNLLGIGVIAVDEELAALVADDIESHTFLISVMIILLVMK